MIIALLAAAGMVTLAARAADAPSITGISPTSGVMGSSVSIVGRNFTESNTIDWGFGRAILHATGNPTGVQTITFRMGTDCAGAEENPCGSVPIGGEGLVDIRVTNANGTSNKATFLLKSHASACYAVDATANGPVARKLACTDLACEVGDCIRPQPSPSPTPTPTPAAATPTPKPSPTPLVSVEEDEDGSSSSGSTAGSSTGSSSTAVRGPSAADRAAADFIQNSTVPVVVEQLYRQVYGQPTTVCTSHYWKFRARTDKATRSKLLGAMMWQKARGRNPVFRSCLQQQQAGRVAGASTQSGNITHHDINRLFRQTHSGVNPTVAQNRYWLGRLKDKPTQAAMLGAMQWHFFNNTGF